MGHQVIKLQNPLKTLGFLQFYRFKTVKDRIIYHISISINCFFPIGFFGYCPRLSWRDRAGKISSCTAIAAYFPCAGLRIKKLHRNTVHQKAAQKHCASKSCAVFVYIKKPRSVSAQLLTVINLFLENNLQTSGWCLQTAELRFPVSCQLT